MVHFLNEGLPPENMPVVQRKKMAWRSRNFEVIMGILYRRGIDQILRRCVHKFEQKVILTEAHSGDAGGHYSGQVTAKKIFQAGLWWPLVFKDAHDFVKSCLICQRDNRPLDVDRMPLQPILPLEPF